MTKILRSSRRLTLILLLATSLPTFAQYEPSADVRAGLNATAASIATLVVRADQARRTGDATAARAQLGIVVSLLAALDDMLATIDDPRASADAIKAVNGPEANHAAWLETFAARRDAPHARDVLWASLQHHLTPEPEWTARVNEGAEEHAVAEGVHRVADRTDRVGHARKWLRTDLERATGSRDPTALAQEM